MFFPSYADVQRKEHTYTKYKHLKFYKPESGIHTRELEPSPVKAFINTYS